MFSRQHELDKYDGYDDFDRSPKNSQQTLSKSVLSNAPPSPEHHQSPLIKSMNSINGNSLVGKNINNGCSRSGVDVDLLINPPTANSSDPLFSDKLTNTIHNFCRVTNNSKFTISSVAEYIVEFKKSPILGSILMDNQLCGGSTNNSTLAVLRAFVNSRERNIPSVFLPRLLALANATVVMSPTRLTSVNSVVATVSCKNTKPSRTLSRLSAEAMTVNLQRDMSNHLTYTVNQDLSRVPVRIKFTSELKNQLVNAQIDLFQAIAEGNRRHNIEPSKYLKTKLNGRNSSARGTCSENLL